MDSGASGLASLTINDVSPAQLTAMADGLVRGGHRHMAGQMYELALRRAADVDKPRIRAAMGLADAPTARTGLMVDILSQLEAARVAGPFVSEGLATWMKTLPFAEDPRFVEIADRHRRLLPVPNWQWNLQTALWAVQEARDIPGDYMELGVFKGHTTLFCSEYVEFQTWPKTWWLYDTFTGIPADQQAPGWADRDAGLYKGTFSYEEVAARFAHIPNVRVIQGRVPEILHDGAPEAIAFLHVDLNNAPAEIGALEFLFDRVSPGGLILFDDFCWTTARAQYDAETAWFAARGLRILPLPTGQGLFLKR